MTELVLIANAEDGSISALRLHRDDSPRLEPLTTTGGLPGCGTFAVDPERDLVYAAYKGDPPGIAILGLDRASGKLTERSRSDVEDSMTYLTLAHDGSLLLGASYGGGFGAVWPVGADAQTSALGESTARIEYRNLHCVVTDSNHAYFVALGDDIIAQYQLGADGTLVPLDTVTADAPAGSGPRHLVVEGPNAYLMTEYSGEAIRFERRSDGSLVARESVIVVDPDQGLAHSRFGADPVEESLIWGADIHRAGRWLLTSERNSSLITSTALGTDGTLGEVAHFTPTEKQPRGFAVTDDGQYVIAVGERSTQAALSRVEDDGSLTRLDTAGIGSGPNWVRIVGTPE